NMHEWCQERLERYRPGRIMSTDIDIINMTTDRVLRGGAFTPRPAYVRSAVRGANAPSSRSTNYRFRTARTFPSVSLPLLADIPADPAIEGVLRQMEWEKRTARISSDLERRFSHAQEDPQAIHRPGEGRHPSAPPPRTRPRLGPVRPARHPLHHVLP